MKERPECWNVKTVDGRLYVISGKSRSGKTAWTVRAMKGSRRAFAWDPDAQWCELPGWRKVTKRTELLALCKAPGTVKVAYVAGGDIKAEFQFWAGCVLYSGRYVGPLDAVAEELARVTNQGKATGKWGELVCQGLKRGISIYAISQRWQDADKTAIENSSEIVCFASLPRGYAYMAGETGLTVDELKGLKVVKYPDGRTKECPFIRVADGEVIERGKLRF